MREPRRPVYLQRVGLFHPPPSPVLANIHVVPCVFFTPDHAERTMLTQCRPTHPIPVQGWAGVAAHCWFNAVNRIRRWPNIETELGDCPVFALTVVRVH